MNRKEIEPRNFLILLNAHLKDRAYITGDNFCMGDIPPGAAAYRYFTMAIDRPAFPHLEQWYRVLQEREAFLKLVMVPLA